MKNFLLTVLYGVISGLALAAAVMIILAVGGCTDAQRAHLSQFNDPAEIVCWSGGKEVYHGKSTGKVSSNAEEDGLYFKDADTGRFVRVYADCVVKSL